jgi:hypothetical protein
MNALLPPQKQTRETKIQKETEKYPLPGDRKEEKEEEEKGKIDTVGQDKRAQREELQHEGAPLRVKGNVCQDRFQGDKNTILLEQGTRHIPTVPLSSFHAAEE